MTGPSGYAGSPAYDHLPPDAPDSYPAAYPGSPAYGPFRGDTGGHAPIPGPRFGESPISGPPQRPVSVPPDPLLDGGANWQPRIVPSPPPQRGRLIVGLVAGLVAGLLVFGAAGFVAGRSTAAAKEATVRATPSAAASAPALSVFQRAQEAANRRKLAPGLEGIAAPWLPYVGDCMRNGEGTLKLGRGEKARMRCHHGDVVVTFVEYRSLADRDKVRIANLGQNVDARQLTPGVAARREGFTPSGRMAGEYVEYAYTVKVGESDVPVAALWWDDGGAPVGAYLLAYWREKMGGSWEPLRDLWAAHS